ncbi:MAG TPA: methyl-accepting chemotaxis protein [Opitutaceae bacterium]|nr:methyl-accepting chemotaxis protein [Opitutaceae bacterium]
MFKTQKLGTKLTGSFAALAALSLLLGGLAVYTMLKVKRTATALAVENVPEVALANEVERAALRTMYDIRGYALSEERGFLEGGRTHLAKVKESLSAAAQHAQRHDLALLRTNAELGAGKAQAYEQLVNDTEALTAALARDKAALNSAAAAFVASSTDFFASQRRQLEQELSALAANRLAEDQLKERLQKVAVAKEIADVGNTIRVGAWRAIAERDPVVFNETMRLFSEVTTHLDALRAITRQEGNLRQISECRAAAMAYLDGMGTFLANWKKREGVGSQRTIVGNEVLAAAEQTATAGMKSTIDATEATAVALNRSSNTLIVGSLACLGIGLALGILISRSITRPIISVAEALSAGSEQTAAAAGQVSASSQSLAGGASEQAASLEETSSSLEEMASMTRRNADNARRANDLAKETRAAAEVGARDMEAMSVAMREIKASSDDIAKILKTIDEIAFQTNILALNAAVEAARAGESGAGFAVVADEVRSLAQRAAQAAKETAMKIESAITKTAQGVQLSERVANALQDIVGKARQVDELAGDVSQASQEQTTGIAQLNQTIAQMDQVTQATAAGAEEGASAAEELTAQAASLQEAVRELRALVDGSSIDHTRSKTVGSSPRGSSHENPMPAAARKSAGRPAKTAPSRSGSAVTSGSFVNL